MSTYKQSSDLAPASGGGAQSGDPYAVSGLGGGGGIARPAAPAGTVPQSGDNFNGPGSIDFNLLQPADSLNDAGQQAQDMWGGLKAFLFGTNAPGANGHHGGVVGDIPIVGDVTRGAADVVGGVGGAVIDTTAKTLGGGLEHITLPGGEEAAKAEFDQLAKDDPNRIAAEKAMAEDRGLFGTGLLTAHGSIMSQAVAKSQEEAQKDNPNLWSGLFRPSASLADTVTNMFGLLGAGTRLVERGVAGAGRPGAGGMNQLQLIRAVGDGNAVWTSDDPGLTPVEQMAYDNTKSGKWTDAQALDFLASHGAGFAHNKMLEIAGGVALDPLNVATFGAGAVAKLGETGFVLAKTLQEAQAGLKAAEAAGDAEKIAQYTKAVETASQGIRSGMGAEGIGSRDLLGQLAKQRWTGNVARRYGAFYGASEGTAYGRAAKIARTVIDPLHAVGINPRGLQAVEEGSRDVTKAVAMAHGELEHIGLTRDLRGLPGGDALSEAYNNGLAIYSGNVFRRVAGRQYRAVQMMMSDKGERLIETLPFESLKAATSNLRRNALTQLEEEAGKYVRGVWSAEDDANLAQRMRVLWGGEDAEGAYDELLKGMSGNQKSLLHAATYGSAVKQLHEAKAAVIASGEAGALADKLDRIVLLNRTTLTDFGHEGIMARLGAATTDAERIAIIEEAKQTYPELRSFTIDPTSHRATVENFEELMGRIKNRLPTQVRNSERGDLPSALKDFDSRITPSADPTEATFTIGFRPNDEFLWGLERDSDGVLREVTDPWMDQVSDNVSMYAPVREVPTNIAGTPIVGAVAEAGARFLDHSEAIGRMAMHGVTGTMVTQAAHIKFTERLHAAMIAEDGTELLTKSQVDGIWKALMDKVENTEDISGVRGLSEKGMWKAAKASIPTYAQRAGLGPRELMQHVLDAYDGDIRTIGLTQKLSGRVKAMLGHTFMGNTAGVIAEHAWPLLKFRLNPFFQLQEKVEPWVLNAQRGVSMALGTKTTELDRKAMDLYLNYADKGLINIADNDIAELSGRYALGEGLQRAARAERGPMRGWGDRLQGLTDVQGTKQLNMMRTWKKGLGKGMRDEWERVNPGEFDRMLDHYRGTLGEAVSEDDFAVMMAHQQLAANGIFSKMVDGIPHMDFTNAIMEGQWAAPQDLGEMRPINLDYMAQRLLLSDNTGRELSTSMDIRRALADGRITQEDVSRELRTMGAHPDYIKRVESAFSFSYHDWWNEVQTAFSLTPAERANLEGMFARVAQNRQMTPVEYLSQVYAPHIARGNEASVGSLGALVDFQRAGGYVDQLPDLAQLRGVAGQTGIQDLYHQMGQVFAAHLDPSAKRAILNDLMAGNPGFTPPTDITDIIDTWDQLGATDQMMDRIMNFIQGTPGTGNHTLVADEATGIEAIRNHAAEYRQRQGRPRNMQRATYEDNPALAQQVADDYEAMPQWSHIGTQDELDHQIDLSTVDAIAGESTMRQYHLRPGAGEMAPQVRRAYEAQGVETRRLYKNITKPVSEGGLGIKVRPMKSPRPYADADALRADLARGVIKVPRSGYWHPYFGQQDAFMQRVVADVFGHGQEAVGLGSHDAIMSAAAMYSDDARPTYLVDEFGSKAWESSDASRIRQAVDYPENIQQYEDRWGDRITRPTRYSSPQGTGTRMASRSVGPGVYASAPEVQEELARTFGDIRAQFPDVPFASFDVADLSGMGAGAATMVFSGEEPTIVFHRPEGWQIDPTERASARARRLQVMNQRRDPITGVPELASGTPRGDIYHEFGHVVDKYLHQLYADAENGGNFVRSVYHDDELTNFMDWYRDSGAAAKVSKYAATTNNHFVMKDAEGFAELFDLAFNPEHVDEVFDPLVEQAVSGFRDRLESLGIWNPQGVPAPVNPHAGQTVAEARAAGASIPATRKVGLLPQQTADDLTGAFLGNGRYAEANPDIARVAGYMREFMGDATDWTLQHGEGSPWASFFDHTSGMPVADREPFNVTEAALWHGQAQMMAAKWNDAFRLQYFAQNRSMLQRSLNHPMFGLYPASYMWGKIGPELVKFMALEPFGMKTGAMAYTLMDIQKAVGTQRAFDPEFDAAIEKLGHSAALSWLGYMLPATPWSVPGSFPAWARDMADQGLANQKRVAAGGSPQDNDYISPFNATLKKVFPMSTQLPFFGRAMDEVGAGLPWNQKAPPAPTIYGADPLSGLTEPTPAPAQNAPASATPPTTGAVTGPTQATALGPVLSDTMADLQGSLFG